MAWMAWKKRVEITIPASRIDADLTHFAVPIFLGTATGINSKDTTFVFDEVGANSKKIAITKADGTTQIYGEIEQWDSVGEKAVIWVSKSDLVLTSAGDSTLFLYFDNSKADNNTYIAEVGSRTEVWDSNSKMILHLRESGNGTAGEFVDSTSNSHDGQGGAGVGANTPTQIDGKIGKGQDCDGNDYISVPDSADWDLGTSDFTHSLKVKFDATAGNQCMLGRPTSGVSYFYFAKEGGNIRFRDYNSGIDLIAAWPGLAIDTWYDVEVVRNGNNFYLYINSSQVATQNTPIAMLNRASALQIGGHTGINYYLDGIVDEVRWSVGSDRGQAWRDARIDGDNDDLVSFGDVEENVIEVIEDLDIDIRAKLTVLEDIAIDIRAKYNEKIEDLDIDIRAKKQEFIDIATDIRVKLEEHFKDIDIDIRVKKELIEDINTDIRVVEAIIKDINVDFRVAEAIIKDIDSDIRVVARNIEDINTDIRVVNRVSSNNITVSDLHLEEGYFLADTAVTIKLEVFGAVKMQFKNEAGAWSVLEDYQSTKNWVIATGDGEKKIYARFTDMEGILSDGSDLIDAVLNTATPSSANLEAYIDDSASVAIPDSIYQVSTKPFFRWEVPVFPIPYIGFSYALDVTPDDIVDIETPTLVRNGLEVTKVTPLPEMTINMATGFYYTDLDLRETVTQDLTLDIGGIQDRIDIIYIDSVFGILSVLKGEENVIPIRPNTIENAIELTEVYIPAGAVSIAAVTLIDTRQIYVELRKFLYEPLELGQHVLNVKGICNNGLVSNVASFNIWIADDSPTIGEVKCYTDNTKLVELANGLYQTTDNTPYFEWLPAPSEPGPIRYYYTEDGSEPVLGDSFVVASNYTPGIYSNGITELKVKPYDTITGYWGDTKAFIFIYGTETFTDDTAVISGSTTFRQSLKEVHVKGISWDFDSARICRFYQPLAFDATLLFSVGDIVSVVYGVSNSTLFTGKIKQIERTIDIGHEGITYHCSGPRQELNEEYAYIIHDDYGETSQIIFEDVSMVSAINTIVEKFPKAVKRIENYPIGVNITDEYIGQVVSNVLESIYAKTKYKWYIKPNGSLVSIDLTAISPGQAKFGIYGTTVNAISPQYNVMASNLQFDITNRYNKCIIEGARRHERAVLFASCTAGPYHYGQTEFKEGAFKIYKINSKWDVIKLIKTYVNYKKAMGVAHVPFVGYHPGEVSTTMLTNILGMTICKDNKIYTSQRPGTVALSGWDQHMYYPTVGPNRVIRGEQSQGFLGVDNTIRFSNDIYNYWPIGVVVGHTFPPGTSSEIMMAITRAAWFRKEAMNKTCASVKANVIIETAPLRVVVTIPGTASGISKTLRIVNTGFKYSEDPDNLVDDTTRMTQYADDLLQKYKDIKVNGSITLDTIDLDWDLDKTVNLINTDQVSWSSLNAKVIGIRYNFDANTTTLEITSEYLK